MDRPMEPVLDDAELHVRKEKNKALPSGPVDSSQGVELPSVSASPQTGHEETNSPHSGSQRRNSIERFVDKNKDEPTEPGTAMTLTTDDSLDAVALCHLLHELLQHETSTPEEVLKAVEPVRSDKQWNDVRKEYREQYPDHVEGNLAKCIKKILSKSDFGVFREGMQDKGVEEVLPPDHDEPLYPKEVRNIIIGYSVGLIGVIISFALDLTGTAEELSDMAQSPSCHGPCPRLCDLPDGAPLALQTDAHDLSDAELGEVVLRCGLRIFAIQWMGPIAFPGIWMGVVGAVFFMCLLTWLAGLLHVKCGVRVNYTRKIVHCTGYIINVVVRFAVGSGDEIETVATLLLTSCMIMMLFHLFLLKPARKRFNFCRTMFASVDRAEDRPYTLLWLTTQNAAYFLLFIPLTYALVAKNRYQLMLIPVLVIGFGDGLAEPVGITWGKHKYTARAIWYNGRCCAGSFTRSLEGSLCVYLVGVISVLSCWKWWASDLQVGLAAAAIPIAVTLAEAFGPHAWDNPFLLAVGGGLVVLFVYTIP
eukprot:Hpha_TRINITY_DN16124_c3_g2::TRINITY_DN16124_c3_g2_i1::g.3263::m.3263